MCGPAEPAGIGGRIRPAPAVATTYVPRVTQATAHSPAPAATPASAPDAVVWAGLSADVLTRALDARDPRFDGVFFVGITTTRIYCRPVCPARVSDPSRRRFFPSAATAERAGYRPCLRCRPELAPGRAGAPVDAVARLARVAERRIAAGALNGRPVAALARDLGVSERHLRRACERALGVAPAELAQTHRLLLAKRLLADTRLSVTDVAYASGFQSLRRFNATFRDRYCMPPSAVRRGRPLGAADADGLRLTLAYRPPLAWDALLARLGREAIPGVDVVEGRRYGRTLRIGPHAGTVFAVPVAAGGRGPRGGARCGGHACQVRVDIAPTLVPALMPLLARLRALFDLDAEPAVIDAHLGAGGLADHVRRCPGRRAPGAVDGFDVAFRLLLDDPRPDAARALAGRAAAALGEPLASGHPELTRLMPTAARVAQAGASALEALGVPATRARAVVAVAGMVAAGTLRLEPGGDAAAARRALLAAAGVDDRLARVIVGRALAWPDAFPATDPALQRAAGVASPAALLAAAERWRPWRAYAAEHLAAAATGPASAGVG